MVYQLLLALKDLWRRKATSLILLVQAVMVLVLINLTITSFIDLQRMTKEVKRLNEHQEIYSLMDMTDEKQIDELLSNKERFQDLKALYNYIFNNEEFQSFSLYSSTMDSQEGALLNVDSLERYGNQVVLPYLTVSDLFFKYFNMETDSGRLFSEQDYTTVGESIPVVVGSDFRDVVKTGDSFTDLNGLEYQVVGVLKEGMSYIDIMSSRDFQHLDSMILMPQNVNYAIDNTDLDALINKAYIIPAKEEGMGNVIKYAAELDTYSFAYKSMRDQVTVVVRDKEKWIQMQLFLTSLVSLFTLISFTISFLQFIDKNLYEFGVHLLSGALNSSLVVRVVSQILPFIIIGNLVSLSVAGTGTSGNITILASILLGGMICVVPIVKMNRIEVSTILRWRNR
ncbi:ABC transporter permease [Rossellomorea vietnamensis]|nr:ABC transporter permease [Rossellomorea vietnamensis]